MRIKLRVERPAHFLLPLFWTCPEHVRVRPEEPLAVEMDEMVGIFCNPNFGFPGNLREEALHGSARLECRHKDKAGMATIRLHFPLQRHLVGLDDG